MVYFVTNQQRLDIHPDIKLTRLQNIIEYFKNKDEISLDSETQGFDPHTKSIISLQLGDQYNQFVIDCSTVDISELRDLLESKLILMHNAQFDLRFMFKHGIYIKNIYDTFLAECILTTGYGHQERKLGLGDLSEKYLDVSMDKSIRGNIHREGLSNRVILYGANDVKYLHQIKEKQLELIKQDKLDTVLKLENKAVYVFSLMAYNGISFDVEKWLRIAETTEKEVNSLINKLDNIILTDELFNKFNPGVYQQNLFGFNERKINVNWSSPAQKLQILKCIDKDIISTSDRDLTKLKNKHKIIPLLLEYSKMNKLATSFGKDFIKFINKETGKIHFNIWQILNTGRISMSEPNLLQIPRKGELGPLMRSAFISRKGYKIVGGDYSSFEAAIVAELSNDPLWISILNENKNLHSVLCSETFDIPVEDVEKPFPLKPDITYRSVQKTINFGLIYGMSEFKLADTIQVSIEEAKAIINKFFNKVPKVKTFLNKMANFGKKYGYIRTPIFNRIRKFPEWEILQKNPDNPNKFKWLGSIERASMNTPIQGVNGDIIKLALIKAQEEIDNNNWPVYILLSIYDEINTEAREDIAEEWAKKLEEIMIESAKVVLKKVPIKADVGVSDYWTK